MKKLICLVALSTLITGFSVAQGADKADPVEGNWGMRQQSNGYTLDVTFSIHNQNLTLTNVCTFQGRTAAAHVSVPVQYDGSVLTVLANAQDEESNNGVNCNVSVQSDRMNYVVNGNFLTLSKDGEPQSFTLTKK